jgi:two-component system LytT family response regulator
MRPARTTVVVAEDEAPARRNLLDWLAAVDGIDVVGEAADGPSAVQVVDAAKPDVLFLDIRLPVLSGLEVARHLTHEPLIVFTTAWDRYAVAAFELGAVDYLLKPFGPARLAAALERARGRLDVGTPSSAARAAAAARDPIERLYARVGERIIPVPVDTIIRIEAAGDYADIVTPAGRHLVHVSLADLVTRLDAGRFVRVHRSHIVNLAAVRELAPHDDRRLRIVLSDGSVVVASRSLSGELRRRVR